MSVLSNLSKGSPITLYYGYRAEYGAIKVKNKYDALFRLIRSTPKNRLVAASKFSIDNSKALNGLNGELLFSWFISTASNSHCMAAILLWTQLASDSDYCQPPYSKEESKDMLELILSRVTLTRAASAINRFFEKYMMDYAKTDRDLNRLLSAAYNVMQTAFEMRNDSIEDHSRGKFTRFANICRGLARDASHSKLIVDNDSQDADLVNGFNDLAKEAENA